MRFRYKWWGRGDIDATFGVFFDGFSKILSGTSIMLFVFGMPFDIVIGKILPGIALVNFLGNLWYFYEAKTLAQKECRNDVTSQPFGIGASQISGWLFLIMGPIYWQTNDAMLAFRVGLTASFIGGIIEIIGAFVGKWLTRVVPSSALLGNLASSVFIWLSLIGMITVFDKPLIAVLPMFIIFMDYIAKGKRRFNKIPTGLIVIVLGSLIAWITGSMSVDNLVGSFENIGFYMPGLFAREIFSGFKDVIPYLPVIIPLQIGNFLTTLQGVESARLAGDSYPEKKSMLADGVLTLIGSLLGNPFPTTVYSGHPGWKAIGARSGYSLAVGVIYLLIGFSGLTGVLMNIIPYEVVMVLLVYVGFSITIITFEQNDKKYYGAIFISLIPIIVQYVQLIIDSVLNTVDKTVLDISAEKFAEFSVPINGIQILGYGAFLSSLLFAGFLACMIDKKYKNAAVFSLVLSVCSLVGLIHNDVLQLFPKNGVILGIVYFVLAIIVYQKKFIKDKIGHNDQDLPSENLLEITPRE